MMNKQTIPILKNYKSNIHYHEWNIIELFRPSSS